MEEHKHEKVLRNLWLTLLLMALVIPSVIPVRVKAEETSTPQTTAKPYEDDDSETLPQVGTTFTISDKWGISGYKFRITKSATNGEGEVELIDISEQLRKNRKYQYIGISADTISYNGDTYKFTSVGSRAFANCVDRERGDYQGIEIGGKYLEKIGDEAFAGKMSVTIKAKNLKEIGNRAFANVPYEVKITSDIKTIGSGVFEGCKGDLNDLDLDGIEQIDNKMFSKCQNVESIDISGDRIEKIASKAFANCKKIKGIWIEGGNIKSVGKGAFKGCKKIKKISIEFNGNTINSIAKSAFYTGSKAYSLSLDLVKVEKIDKRLFSGCKNVTGIDVNFDVNSTKLKTISSRTFTNCMNVKEITITGDNLKTIGKEAFKGCKKLKDIRFVEYKALRKLKKVGKNAFKGVHPKCRIQIPIYHKSKAKLLRNKGQAKTVTIWGNSAKNGRLSAPNEKL